MEIQGEDEGNATGSSRNSSTDVIEVRHSNAYIGGDWGKVTIGRQNNPQNRIYKSDIFEQTSGRYELAQAFRIGDAIVYDGMFGGFGLWAGAVMDGQGTDDGEDADSTVLGASFSIGKSISIAIGNQSISADGADGLASSLGEDLSITGIGADWQTGNLVVAGYYESESETETTVYDIGAKFRIGENGVIGGDYALADVDDFEESRILLGYYHNLGGGADWYGEWFDIDSDDDDDDFDGIGLGFRVKFN
jgi:predicted porin